MAETRSHPGGPWLAPRSAPGLLDAAVRLLFSRFGPLFLLALCGSVADWLLGLIGARSVADTPGMPALATHLLGGLQVANPVMGLLGGLVVLLTYGALLGLAGAGAAGTDGSGDARAAIASALRRFWPLLVAAVVSGVVSGIALLVLVVPGVVLLTWWGVTAPVTVIERRSALASLGRSRALVRGLFWHVLGTLLLGTLLMAVTSFVLSLVGGPLGALPGAFGSALQGLWSAGVRAAATAYFSCLLALLYYDLRARKEGIDLVAGGGGAPPDGPGAPRTV